MSQGENLLFGFIVIIVILDIIYCIFMLTEIAEIKTAVVSASPTTAQIYLDTSKNVTWAYITATIITIIGVIIILLFKYPNFMSSLKYGLFASKDVTSKLATKTNAGFQKGLNLNAGLW